MDAFLGANLQTLSFFVFSLVLSIAAGAQNCADQARLSLLQKKMMAPNAGYAGFFASESLPDYKDLLHFYFLEDLVIPEAEFAPDKQARTRRRLRELFEHYVYGYAPDIPDVALNLVSEKKAVEVGRGVKADIKEMDLVLLLSRPGRKDPVVRLTLFSPVNVARPPVFLSLNKCGNHRVAPKGVVAIRNLGFTAPECHEAWFDEIGTDIFWSVDYVLSQGYALATFHESDVSPDNTLLARTGVQSYFAENKYRSPHGWGSIAAWAWGLQAAAKALRDQVQLVNPDKIIAIGHSRRGKAALWATALDPKISMVVAHQAGTLGLALARNHELDSRCAYSRLGYSLWPRLSSQQESLAINNFLFDHWFNDYSENFRRDESKLPVDQHLLLALLSPRPVLSTEGDRDLWSNAESSLVSLQQGSRYYAGGMRADGNVAQIRLNEEHTLTRDFWRKIIEFTKAR